MSNPKSLQCLYYIVSLSFSNNNFRNFFWLKFKTFWDFLQYFLKSMYFLAILTLFFLSKQLCWVPKNAFYYFMNFHEFFPLTLHRKYAHCFAYIDIL